MQPAEKGVEIPLQRAIGNEGDRKEHDKTHNIGILVAACGYPLPGT
jgi:hypothetical protein